MRPVPTDPANTDTPPKCVDECRWRQKYEGFDLQRNALRTETAHMIDPYRCGWNLKPRRIGGKPLDYSACIYRK